MPTHISARLAWHMDGWNGHVCRNPAANTYCVGPHSYPGEMIAEKRNLALEMLPQNAGQPCSKAKDIPPCMYSVNAFGKEAIRAYSESPEFFEKPSREDWQLAPATVCLWPYEWMYGDDVKRENGTFDYTVRLANARKFFAQIEPAKSLIFYYANYSNPLNQADERRYVLVGLSRVKKVGEIRFFDDCSPKDQEKYAGGFIWQCDVTSHYPDEGLRLPYHLYLDRPEVLDRFAFFPDNPRLFKYATREVSDDDALDLVERFMETAGTLRDLGDTSENWGERIVWLQKLVGELWRSRGLYPGTAAVLEVLGFEGAIPFWKAQALAGKEQETKDALFSFLEGRTKRVTGLTLDDKTAAKVVRQWKLRDPDEQRLFRDVLPRFELAPDQVQRVLAKERIESGLNCTLPELAQNPYLLCEQFAGNGPDDLITFGKIDHGVFPSPELGGDPMAEGVDDARRLRGLCVDRLRREGKHVFVPADRLVHEVNHRLSFLPEWKRHQFTERYLDVDAEHLEGALVFRESGGRRYVYWKPVYEDERVIETCLRGLVSRPDISLRSAVTEGTWRNYLTDANSVLSRKAPDRYGQVVASQAAACQKVFRRPTSVICGGAGTGKTRVIDAIIKAIEKGHGAGTSFLLLAPTGKAADRVREATGKPAATIHSFLAQRDWLNPNMTFRRAGGKREDKVQTLIIDESSMLDLGLAAALFRAVEWKAVQRLIFVGDPNQLPPIGTGRVFADLITWLREEQPDSIVRLEHNVRQMENEISGRGRGILALAGLYVRDEPEADNEAAKADAEALLQKVQEGGEVDKDLRVVYWRDAEELTRVLEASIVADLEADTGEAFDRDKPYEVWRQACKGAGEVERPDYLQVLSPYRGEPFGTENLNTALQRLFQPKARGVAGQTRQVLDGVMLFDKVIQVCNRYAKERWALHGYNTSTRTNEPVDVFNGQLGFVKPHGLDGKVWRTPYFRLEKFQVVFARREHLWVGYGSRLGKKNLSDPKSGWIAEQKVEENLELAYAISVHRAQGSEFERVYFVVPKHKAALLSPELFYTGLTRARRHCTVFVEQDVSPLLSMRRRERSHLLCINSSLFDFRPLPDDLLDMRAWYEEGKIHQTLARYMVRSKSEVIIANMLHERGIPFTYETPRQAPDGTFYLPDFTVTWNGEPWFWEHWGLMHDEKYRNHRETKLKWYEQNFPGRLVETFESNDLSVEADAVIRRHFM